tara:strand:+ start:1692 stop:1859 length:168 start_codon:yes stop_codon:yes gene_type:complete
MGKNKEKDTVIDWIGNVIGLVVIGFIVFILIWPIIDPTPNKSSSLKENIHKATGK